MKKTLEKIGNVREDAYERNMRAQQLRRQQTGVNQEAQAQAEFEEFARREAELLAENLQEEDDVLDDEESKEDQVPLSDETVIGGEPWSVLKIKAMQDDYEK